MIARTVAATLLLSLVSGQAWSHELDHEVVYAEAVVVRFHFADGSPFSYESFEVTKPGEKIPFQVGRTDAEGRVVFVPDVDGEWRVRVFSEDGHGADFAVDVAAAREGGGTDVGGAAALPRPVRVLVGLAVIFGVFGTLSLFARRKER